MARHRDWYFFRETNSDAHNLYGPWMRRRRTKVLMQTRRDADADTKGYRFLFGNTNRKRDVNELAGKKGVFGQIKL